MCNGTEKYVHDEETQRVEDDVNEETDKSYRKNRNRDSKRNF